MYWSSSAYTNTVSVWTTTHINVGIVYFDWVNMNFVVRDGSGKIIKRGKIEDVVPYALKSFHRVLLLKETFPDLREMRGTAKIVRGQNSAVLLNLLRPLRKDEAYHVEVSSSDDVLLDYEIDNDKLVIKSLDVVDRDIDVMFTVKIVGKEKVDS